MERRCLKCDKGFEAKSKTNRICSECHAEIDSVASIYKLATPYELKDQHRERLHERAYCFR